MNARRWLLSALAVAGLVVVGSVATTSRPKFALSSTNLAVTGVAVGAAGGALTGNYPNPGVNVGAGSLVTGSLPAGNQAAQTCTGDVTGNTGATVVSAISGSTPISITPATLQWATGTSAPTLTQASESTATKGADMSITPQQSTHATDQGGGNAIVKLETPAGAGVEALLEVNRGANFSAAMGPLLTAGSSFSALYLGPSLSPSSTNFALTSNGTNLTVNAPSSGTISFSTSNGTAEAAFTPSELILVTPVGGNTSTPFRWLATASAIACGTGGTQTISAAQASTPGLTITSGTLSSNCVLDFSTNASTGWYQLDMSGVTLGATFGVQFKNGSATSTVVSTGVLAGQTLATVWTHGANTLAVNY